MRAKELMTKSPLHASPATSISSVLDMLLENDFRHLPIVENGTLVGIVSDRDLRPFQATAWAQSGDWEEFTARLAQPVSSLMNGAVVAVDEEAELDVIVQTMIDERVGAVPITRGPDSALIGIVSYVDVLRTMTD
jgi:acetoin utilization protein AcuB